MYMRLHTGMNSDSRSAFRRETFIRACVCVCVPICAYCAFASVCTAWQTEILVLLTGRRVLPINRLTLENQIKLKLCIIS